MGGFNRRIGRKGIMTLTIRSANKGSRPGVLVHIRSVEEQFARRRVQYEFILRRPRPIKPGHNSAMAIPKFSV